MIKKEKTETSSISPYIKYIVFGRQSHSFFSIVCEFCLLKYLIVFNVFVQHEQSFFYFYILVILHATILAKKFGAVSYC